MIPVVSVIVPIYNVEKYLERCMNSLLNQTLKNIEIIMVDDESPDNCPVMCEEYAKKDSRIKVIHKKNAGLGYARNSGLEVATGKYVSFIDSDDYITSTMLENLYNSAVKYSADAVFSGYRMIDDQGRTIEYMNPYGNSVFEREQINNLLFDMLGAEPTFSKDQYVLISSCTAIYKKEILDKEQIRFPSEREYISEDMIFNMIFLQRANRVVTSNKIEYFYWYNDKSLTRSYKKERFEKIKILYYKEIELLKQFGLEGEGRQRVQRTFLGNVRVCLKQVASLSTMSLCDKEAMIKEICRDELVKKILTEYPWRENPLKQRIMSWLIGRELNLAIILCCKLGS